MVRYYSPKTLLKEQGKVLCCVFFYIQITTVNKVNEVFFQGIMVSMLQYGLEKVKLWRQYINSLRGKSFNINQSINQCSLAVVYGSTDKSAELYRREGV